MQLLFLFLGAALGILCLYINVKLCISCSASTNIVPGAFAVLVQLYQEKAAYDKMTFSSCRRRCSLHGNTIIVSVRCLVLGGGEFLYCSTKGRKGIYDMSAVWKTFQECRLKDNIDIQVVLHIQNSPKEHCEGCLTQARDPQNPVFSQKLSLSKQGHIQRVSLGKTVACELFGFFGLFLAGFTAIIRCNKISAVHDNSPNNLQLEFC